MRTPERYLDAVDGGVVARGGRRAARRARSALEGLQLSLRTEAGVPSAALDADALPGLVAPSPDDPGRTVLTVDGRLLANEVALRLRVPVTDG